MESAATADALAESSAERWRFSGGRDPETGSSGGPPMWRPRNASVRDGTMSSNLLCSSGESSANLTSWMRRLAALDPLPGKDRSLTQMHRPSAHAPEDASPRAPTGRHSCRVN
jgi:hypothetical protein